MKKIFYLKKAIFSLFEVWIFRLRNSISPIPRRYCRKKNVTSLFFSFFAKALTCAMNLTVWLLFYWIKFISETSACAYSIFFSYNHRVVSSFLSYIHILCFHLPELASRNKAKKNVRSRALSTFTGNSISKTSFYYYSFI